MSYRCLADFLEELQRLGEMVRVPVEVDPAREVAAITSRVARSGGPALLFGAVKGHDLAILTNLLASEKRICQAMGIGSLDEAAGRIAQLLAPSTPEGWLDRLKGGSHPALASMAARNVKAAPCQQIVRLASDIDLGRLPLLQVSPQETARSITAATVFTAEPDSHRSVAGRFDLQQIDRAQMAICWADHDEHARLLSEYRQRGRKMPLAVVLGGDPAFLLASAAPLPSGGDVCAVAGLLRDKPLDVVACRSVDLDVPAESEIIVEGYCDPAEPLTMAGVQYTPMGCNFAPRPVPVMHVTAVTHRANPIYAVMVPGPPPHEACVVDRAMQRVFLPLTRLAMPDLIDYDLPEFGAARHWAAVSIHKTYPGQAHRAAHAAWGLRPMRFAKVLIVVEDDIDVHDPLAVLSAVAANMNPACDVIMEDGPPDPFDPVAASGVLARRMAMDATRKRPGERESVVPVAIAHATATHATVAAHSASMERDMRELVSKRWAEYGLEDIS